MAIMVYIEDKRQEYMSLPYLQDSLNSAPGGAGNAMETREYYVVVCFLALICFA